MPLRKGDTAVLVCAGLAAPPVPSPVPPSQGRDGVPQHSAGTGRGPVHIGRGNTRPSHQRKYRVWG